MSKKFEADMLTIGEVVHDFEEDIQNGRVVAVQINEDDTYEVAMMRAAFADVVSGARSLETQLYEYPDKNTELEEEEMSKSQNLLNLPRTDPRRGDWECIQCGRTYPVTYEPGTCADDGAPLVRVFTEDGERTAIHSEIEKMNVAPVEEVKQAIPATVLAMKLKEIGLTVEDLGIESFEFRGVNAQGEEAVTMADDLVEVNEAIAKQAGEVVSEIVAERVYEVGEER